MKCYEHPDIDAVIQCQNCSKGMCRNCADRLNPSLCLTCARQIIAQEIAKAKELLRELKTTKVKIILSLIWASGCMIMGVYSAFGRFSLVGSGNWWSSADWWFNLIIFFGFGGLPWLISSSLHSVDTTEKQLEKLRGDIRVASYGVGAEFMGRLVAAIVSFVFAAICTPFRFLMSIRDLRYLKVTKLEIEKMIAENM